MFFTNSPLESHPQFSILNKCPSQLGTFSLDSVEKCLLSQFMFNVTERKCMIDLFIAHPTSNNRASPKFENQGGLCSNPVLTKSKVWSLTKSPVFLNLNCMKTVTKYSNITMFLNFSYCRKIAAKWQGLSRLLHGKIRFVYKVYCIAQDIQKMLLKMLWRRTTTKGCWQSRGRRWLQ